MAQAGRLAPGDWKHRNIQVVIAAKVIGKTPGRPRPGTGDAHANACCVPLATRFPLSTRHRSYWQFRADPRP
jgi:hypothetical protein